MKKNIFLTFALSLAFAGMAWGQATSEPFTASITNTPITYDGQAHSPEITANCSYGTTFAAVTNAGTYSVTVTNICTGHTTGTGTLTHTGEVTLDFVIEPHNIADAAFVTTVNANDMKWTGNTLTPTQGDGDEKYQIKATIGGSETDLVLNTDYTFYTIPSEVKNEGEYTIVFVGKGNYKGTVSTTFNVLKNMAAAENVTGIHFDIPTQLITTADYDFTAVVTDKKSHTTLYEGTDFELHFFATDAKADAYVTAADAAAETAALTEEKTEADIKTAGEGKYYVVAKGLAPKYEGKVAKAFYLVNEYQTVAAGEYAAVSLHITEPGYPVAENSPTGAVVKGEMQVGANGAAAVATDAKRVLIPAENTVKPDGTDEVTFTVVGIENGAFNGCTELRFIDARLIDNYTPSSLSRTATNTPFTGVPKQTLVYLTGTTVEGENYIYDTGAGLNCETFKIYDDISGTQTGFTTATDAKWDMEIPVAFTANNIVNTRKLTAVANNKQQGYTVCLPYALPIPESVTAYQLSYSKTDMLGFTEVAATELTAMRPYVLIPSASGQCLSTTNALVSQTVKYESGEWKYEACTAAPLSSSAASGQNLYKLTGSMQYKEGDAAKDKYIMQANNVWGKIAAGAGYSETDHSCVLPMRAYIEANGIATARLFSTFNNADGSTTVVKGLQIDADAAGDIYDLQGRKVAAPQRGGLYIINGKKVVMK